MSSRTDKNFRFAVIKQSAYIYSEVTNGFPLMFTFCASVMANFGWGVEKEDSP